MSWFWKEAQGGSVRAWALPRTQQAAPRGASAPPRARGGSYLPVAAVLRQVEHRQRARHHQPQPLREHRRVSPSPSVASCPCVGRRAPAGAARGRGPHQGVLVDVGPLNLLGSVPGQHHGSAQHVQVLLRGQRGRRDTGALHPVVTSVLRNAPLPNLGSTPGAPCPPPVGATPTSCPGSSGCCWQYPGGIAAAGVPKWGC